jgi:hypothetical protein
MRVNANVGPQPLGDTIGILREVRTLADAVDKLMERLSETIALLRKYKEKSWADWLQQDHDWIAQRNFWGIQHLLNAFGGMGSFSDLLIHPANGHALQEEEVVPVNTRLNALRSELYALAAKIKREVEHE